MNSSKVSSLASGLKGFFLDYVPRQRALSPHTLQSYRDSLKLLQFTAGDKRDPSQLTVEDLSVERGCSVPSEPGDARESQPALATSG